MQQDYKRKVRPLSTQIAMAMSFLPYDISTAQIEPSAPKELPRDVQKMLRGVWQYQTHDYLRSAVGLDEIWRAGEVSISAIPAHEYGASNETILLVPSLINKAYVFDLCEARSIMRWLATQGLNPYLLSWGEPTQDEGQAEMDDVVLRRLVPGIEFLSGHAGKDIHALGYCMGGTLLAAAAAQDNVKLSSLILLATPWDFHGGSGALLNRVKFWAPSAFPAIDAKGYLGVDWIQTVFASLDPSSALRKFSNFSDMDMDGERAHLFIAVEDWLNDGVDLPGQIAQHCISEWFIKNTPHTAEWNLGGRTVDVKKIKCRSLIIASDKDRLVEYESAAVLAQNIPNAKTLNPSCGHIGMIAGRHSIKDVWEPLAEWIKT